MTGKKAAAILISQDRKMFGQFHSLNHVPDFVFQCGYEVVSSAS